MVEHSGQGGTEALELADPVGQRRERPDDDEGSIDALGLEVGQEADGLDLEEEWTAWNNMERGEPMESCVHNAHKVSNIKKIWHFLQGSKPKVNNSGPALNPSNLMKV